MKSYSCCLALAVTALLVVAAGAFAGGATDESGAAPAAEMEAAAGAEAPGEYREHPLLAEMVRQGLIPPVAERLPDEPKVVTPLDEVGRYGGTANIYEPTYTFELMQLMGVATPFVQDVHGTPGLPQLYLGYEVNDDFTEWTFHLRPGVKWSDGELFTARTMYDYWRYYRANPDINPQIDPDKVVIEDNAITFTDEPLEAVGRTVRKEIIDDYTIKYTSDKPYPFLINSASHSYSMMESVIRPMHFLNQLDPTFIGMEAAQTLAQKAGFEHWYQLYLQVGRAQRQSSGQFIGNLPPTLAPYVMVDVGAARRVYERNPYYWKVDTAGQQLPYIDRIVTNQVTDREAVDARIIAGDADFAGFNTNTPSIPLYRQYEEQGGYRTTIWQNTFTALVLWPNYCYADEALATAFRNRDFRMALQLAVDRHRINDEVMFGQSRVVRHVPKPETNILFEKELETKYIEFEPERSAAILDEIGYVDADGDGWRDAPGGAPLKWTIPYMDVETPRVPIIEIILEDWHELGLNVDAQIVEGSLHWQMFGANELPMLLWHSQSNIPLSQSRDFHGAPGHNGVCWRTWYISRGASGVEPPPEVVEFYDWFYQEYLTAGSEEEMREAGLKVWRSQVENFWFIDTVADFPYPVVTAKDMKNIPTREHGPLYWSWDVWWANAYTPAQFFFEGRPQITAEDSLLPQMYDLAQRAKHPIDRAVDHGWLGTE